MISFTRLTSKQPNTLTKQYRLDKTGNLKINTAAQMVVGDAERVQVSSASDFANVLQQLEHSQALCYGVTASAKVRILSREEHAKQGNPADAVQRTNAHLTWPKGAGVLMLDYDPQDGQPTLSRAQLLQHLAEVMPAIESAAYVWWCSASSLIFNDGAPVTGVKGQRVYILIENAADTKRAGDVLFNRLWLAGHGFYMVSRAGRPLERTIVDNAVWQPSRLDFAAGAKCLPPLKQERGLPAAHDGELLDTAAALPDLNPVEQAELQAIKERAKQAISAQVAQVRAAYINDEAQKLQALKGADANDETLRQIEETLSRAIDGGILAGDFTITLADKVTQITIGEALDNPTQYHNQATLDPLEPEYNGHKVTGRLYLIGGNPNLYSQAHGGQNFRLIRQPQEIQHKGGRTADTTRRTLDYMAQLPDVYNLGRALVLVRSGSTQELQQASLGYWLGMVAQFYRLDKMGENKIPVDPPQETIKQILADSQNRGLKQLKAVITAPVIDTTGRVIDRIGYDTTTQLFLDMQSDPLPVPDRPTQEQVRLALDVLMQPFDGFKTATPLDRGVLLAAILTAVQRPVLTTAPAFGLDAPVQGTGKTYLAQCLGALATGATPPVYPHTAGRDDDEVRKRLTSVLITGARVMVWDNVMGAFNSASMASMLTSEVFSDRILGKSENATIPSRMLMLLTGNNLTFEGELPRRVLKCRLDAQLANPAIRKFYSNPLYYILENRAELVQAALTIIRGYLQSWERVSGGAVAGESTASFEDWDAMIRQPVAWIAGALGRDDFADPAQALKDAVAEDPEIERLAGLLEGIEQLIGLDWFAAKDLQTMLAPHAPLTVGTAGDVRDLVEEMLGRSNFTAGSLGKLLAFRKDRIAGDLKLVVHKANRRTRFKLVRVAGDPLPSASNTGAPPPVMMAPSKRGANQ